VLRPPLWNGKAITIIGARENNSRTSMYASAWATVCITGVSGSGKSSLMIEVLYKAWLDTCITPHPTRRPRRIDVWKSG